ncbi:MAG: DUF1214 domain-containing protein [Sphingobium sp.]
MSATQDDLPGWGDYCAALGEADSVLDLVAGSDDPRMRQEVYRLLFQALAQGYANGFLDPLFPDFYPDNNCVFNIATANPDFAYLLATIDGTRAYRISGRRGDALFVHIDIVSGGLGTMQEPGPSVGGFDLDQIDHDADGNFELLLSTERPAGHEGNWIALPQNAKRLLVREARYDWRGADSLRLAISCLDAPATPAPLSAEETARRLTRLAAQPARYTRIWLGNVARMRKAGLTNAVETGNFAGQGGFSSQYYAQGLYAIPPGHALLLETELPGCAYWNVQLSDPLWSAGDFVNRQTSVSGGTAHIDGDGRFRAIIALDDPGVPNWLDPAGNSEGAVMLRFTRGDSQPVPKITPVPLDAIRAHLPADTPVVTPEERRAALRHRRESAQLRRRW